MAERGLAERGLGPSLFPIALGWQTGAVLATVGAGLLIVGWVQGRRDWDPDKVRLVAPMTKTVAGGFLLLVGLLQMIDLLRDL